MPFVFCKVILHELNGLPMLRLSLPLKRHLSFWFRMGVRDLSPLSKALISPRSHIVSYELAVSLSVFRNIRLYHETFKSAIVPSIQGN